MPLAPARMLEFFHAKNVDLAAFIHCNREVNNRYHRLAVNFPFFVWQVEVISANIKPSDRGDISSDRAKGNLASAAVSDAHRDDLGDSLPWKIVNV
jgi:hypothetical protein